MENNAYICTKVIYNKMTMMKKETIITLMMCICSVAFGTETADRLLAFPTAEGYGKYTIGGRGGKVIHVTNLNDAGAGSVRETLARSGPRIVVFDVSYICSIWIIPPPP